MYFPAIALALSATVLALPADSSSASASASSATASSSSSACPTPTTIALSINSTEFDISYLQTTRVSYANSSLYIGQIKYQTYSEPLIVNNNLGVGGDSSGSGSGSGSGLSFQSIHSSPTGSQQVYVYANQSEPVWLSPPHGSPPAGASTAEFNFGPGPATGLEELQINGTNLFYACQTLETAALNTYQIFWLGAGPPVSTSAASGVNCTAHPIQILPSDAASRF